MSNELLDEIRLHSDNISDFLSEAARERLKGERYFRSVSESAGAWRDEEHPDLETMDDIVAYVDDSRDVWTRTGKRD